MAGNHPIVVIWTAILFHEITCRGVCRIIERFFWVSLKWSATRWLKNPGLQSFRLVLWQNHRSWVTWVTWVPQKHRDQMGKTGTEVVRVGVGPHVDSQDSQGGCHRCHLFFPMEISRSNSFFMFFPWFFMFQPKFMDGWTPFVGEMCEVHFKSTSYIPISSNFWSFMDRQFMSIPKIMVLTSWTYVIYGDFTYISYDFNWFHISFTWTLDIEWIESQIYGAVWLRPCP